jgi:hypothetical protein
MNLFNKISSYLEHDHSKIQEAYEYVLSSDFPKFLFIRQEPHLIADFIKNDIEVFSLYNHQIELMNQLKDHTDFLVIQAKGMGITTVLVMYSLFKACFFNNMKIGYVSTNKNAYNMFMDFYNNNMLKLPTIAYRTKDTIEFCNKSWIKFVNSDSTFITASNYYDFFIIDDAGNIPIDCSNILYETMMYGTKYQMIINGTPNVNSFLYVINKMKSLKKLDLPIDLHPDYSEEWIKDKKRGISKEEFDRLYKCKFMTYFV